MSIPDQALLTIWYGEMGAILRAWNKLWKYWQKNFQVPALCVLVMFHWQYENCQNCVSNTCQTRDSGNFLCPLVLVLCW